MGYQRKIKAMLALGCSVSEICRTIGISEDMYLRWTETDNRRTVRHLASENTRLKSILHKSAATFNPIGENA